MVGDDRDVEVVIGRRYHCDATVVAVDVAKDLALLRVEYDGALPAMPLGNAAAVRPAENVLALGFPEVYHLGDSETVTRGIVSAVRHSGGVQYIQTDAAINQGNSGGPLVDQEKGVVIGVNTFGIRGSDNIAYAISVDEVKSLLAGSSRNRRQSRRRARRQSRSQASYSSAARYADYAPTYDDNEYVDEPVRRKSTALAYVLLIFLGWLGVHRFYLGRWKTGLAMLGLWILTIPTSGVVGVALVIWIIVDLFLVPGMIRKYEQDG